MANSRRLDSHIAATAALLVMAGVAGVAAAPERSPAELAQALQQRYERIKDFSADFVHVYQGGVLHKQVSEQGHLLVKKPGKMRWDYTTPERKEFVSDGVRMYSYIPADKQVVVSPVPQEDEATTPSLFLAGKGNLTRDFTASAAPVPRGMSPGSVAVKLIPKSRQRDYDVLILVADPTSLELRGLVTTDTQGGQSTFTFSGLKENLGLSDKEFTFKIPRGVDVVSASGQ